MTCTFEFTILSTLSEYCAYIYGETTDSDDILKCGENNDECTEDECKVKECLSQEYFVGCSPIEI